MLQSAELVTQYTAQCSKEEFIKNVQLQDSVIRRLGVGDLRMLFRKSEYSVIDFSWTLASKTLRIHQRRRLLVIAEAARRVSEITRQSLPNIAWHEINGMLPSVSS
jgi:uncharacterized protein with HEPN domain